MTDVKITVGGDIERQASERFAAAWRRAERGEHVDERHLAFDNWDVLAKVLATKRTELLRHVHRRPVSSIRELSKALGRHHSNVHADVKALAAEGLLDVGEQGVRTDYGVIEATIAL